MEATDYEFYFDETDYDFKDITQMSLKQLVIYKNQLIKLKECKELTNSQKKALKKFTDRLWEDYPTPKSQSSKQADEDTLKRKIETNKFKEECFKINKLQLKKSHEFLLKIELLEEKLQANSKEKYKAEHKEYLNQRCKCECGMEPIRKHKSAHKKSKYHLIYEEKLAVIAEEKKKKKEIIEEKKRMASKINNGYDLDENNQVIWPIDQEGNRYYLKDEKGKNIYPILENGCSIYMKDSEGFTIIPNKDYDEIHSFLNK